MFRKSLLLAGILAGSVLVPSASAWAAQPIKGATYSATTSAAFVSAADNREELTVAIRASRITGGVLNVPSGCSDGAREDWFAKISVPSPIVVARDGSFTSSITIPANGPDATHGTLTFSTRGSFSSRTTAPTTLEARYTSSSGNYVCEGRVDFTATTTPRLAQRAQLVTPGVSTESGSGLAASATGAVTVVGKAGVGAAFVFIRPASGWRGRVKPITKLRRPPGASRNFGGHVAVSADGSTIAVLDDAIAYMFRRVSRRHWARIGRLPLQLDAGVSGTVAISDSGRTIFGLAAGGGHVDVLSLTRVRGHLGYVRRARLRGDSIEDLSASADGSTVAMLADPAQASEPEVLAYSLPRRGGWARANAAVLRPSVQYARLDTQVAVSANGATIIAGDTEHGLAYAGSVYVFQRRGSRWSGRVNSGVRLNAAYPLCNSGSACDGIGSQLAISPNGSEILGGATISNRTAVFLRVGGRWASEHESFEADHPGTSSLDENAGVRPDDVVAVNGGEVFCEYAEGTTYVFSR